MISKVLFVSNTMNTSVNFKSLHVMASYTALILMGVHLGLHWTFIKQMTGKLFRVKNRVVTLTATALLAMVLIVGGGYNFVNSNVLSHFNTGSGMEAHGAERGDRPEGFSGDGGGHLAPESGSDNGAETTLMREQPTAGGSQALSVVTKYLSMMGFVGTLTAVIDWTVINRRRKGRIAISNA
jgi:ABC-type proline/glycine betaine transport system permease subunit